MKLPRRRDTIRLLCGTTSRNEDGHRSGETRVEQMNREPGLCNLRVDWLGGLARLRLTAPYQLASGRGPLRSASGSEIIDGQWV
jgi:hypothetical protein